MLIAIYEVEWGEGIPRSLVAIADDEAGPIAELMELGCDQEGNSKATRLGYAEPHGRLTEIFTRGEKSCDCLPTEPDVLPKPERSVEYTNPVDGHQQVSIDGGQPIDCTNDEVDRLLNHLHGKPDKPQKAKPSTVGLGGQINKLLDIAQKARKKPKTCRECVSCLVPLPQASYDDGIRRDPRCCYNLEVNEVRAWVALDRPACFLGELRDEPLSEEGDNND